MRTTITTLRSFPGYEIRNSKPVKLKLSSGSIAKNQVVLHVRMYFV